MFRFVRQRSRAAPQTFLACLVFIPLPVTAQTPIPSPPYSLNVTVNEVAITFHASDAHNLPVLDLKPGELDVFDNEQGPGQIVSLQQLRDRSIHAAVVLDISGSVASQISSSRALAQEAVQKLLAQPTDEGIVEAFDRSRHLVRSWTNEKSSLLKSLAQIGAGPHDPIDGSSIYDTLFSTCFFEFGKGADPTVANVILLYSDGVDTASHMTVQAAIDRCRQSHTVVYAFTSNATPGTSSLGTSTLLQITEQTGGRLFRKDGPESESQTDINTVDLDLRNEYFLLYRPKTLTHDGAFHKIVLVGPKRVAQIVGPAGFYAPSR